jgi:hypothetical protein
MYALSNHIDRADDLRPHANKFQEIIESFYMENYDIFAGRNVNPSMLKQRDDKFEEFIVSILGQS